MPPLKCELIENEGNLARSCSCMVLSTCNNRTCGREGGRGISVCVCVSMYLHVEITC